MRADYPVNSGVIDAPGVGMVVGVIGYLLGGQSVSVFVEEAITHQGKFGAADADQVALFIATAISEMTCAKEPPPDRKAQREPRNEEEKQSVEFLAICQSSNRSACLFDIGGGHAWGV